MRTRIGRLFGVLVVATGFVAAGATGASAGNLVERPFDITVQSEFASVPDDSCASGYMQEITGSGRGSHMGRVTVSGEACLGEQTGRVVWTAANGDEIRIVYASEIGPVGVDGSASIELSATDVTGTGRFEHVSLGDGPLAGTVWFYDQMGASGMIVAGYHGTISYDASDRS